VAVAVEKYLRPFVVGKDPDRIEDIYQSSFVNSYWRNGPVLNNALSGVDMASWDIKGKRAGLPVYRLLGGKWREAAALYAHASGRDFQEVEDNACRYMEQGYSYIRAQVAVPGYSTYGARGGGRRVLEPTAYAQIVSRLFEHLRSRLREEIELLHDVHERLPPIQALELAKEPEQYRLFFMEDLFAPEDIEYFRLARQQTSTPLAMGELFTNPNEYLPLIKDRLIDFIRVHLSAIGGLSMGRKLAALCQFLGVRSAWHGPGDVSSVGHAANLALDLACYNFGIQEQHVFSPETQEVFPGCPDIWDGYLWPNEAPGLGVDIDEQLAARFPFPEDPLGGGWDAIRREDEPVIRP